MQHLSTILGWQHTTVTLPVIPLAAPIERVPEPVAELAEESEAVRCFELGRQIGQLNSDESFWRGFGDGFVAAHEPCRRQHRHERPRRRGMRPGTYGVQR